ncbi:hypothetical protein [Actinoplanes utahensis]|nr:hypothetical protein [Actinoplanes utahensis]GIF31994.1 hypothetical protein Aut01nite_49800 [Actinoplanes utahensis]
MNKLTLLAAGLGIAAGAVVTAGPAAAGCPTRTICETPGPSVIGPPQPAPKIVHPDSSVIPAPRPIARPNGAQTVHPQIGSLAWP